MFQMHPVRLLLLSFPNYPYRVPVSVRTLPVTGGALLAVDWRAGGAVANAVSWQLLEEHKSFVAAKTIVLQVLTSVVNRFLANMVLHASPVSQVLIPHYRAALCHYRLSSQYSIRPK